MSGELQGNPRVVAVTQGDPAGIGPEILVKWALGRGAPAGVVPVLVAERAALRALEQSLSDLEWDRLSWVESAEAAGRLPAAQIAVIDPVAEGRRVEPGDPGEADAAGAIAALDVAIELCRSGSAGALVTAPVSKATIARHRLADFRGHTDYLAARFGLERYGRDYLMAFLAGSLQVALVTVHQPLLEAVGSLTADAVLEALLCLDRYAGGRIAVPGINPHAGEEGLLGSEDGDVVAPAIARARERSVDAHGPESPDSVFARALDGGFDWVLALYHDQGLIAVKTASFGSSVNWTLGLPVVRTSVDHGTAYDIAGRGIADSTPMSHAVAAAAALLEGALPLSSHRAPTAPPESS